MQSKGKKLNRPKNSCNNAHISFKKLEDAILSPRTCSLVSFLSSSSSFRSSHSNVESLDSNTQFNPQLQERGSNITSTKVSHSRFPHESPSNKIKADGISYYYLPSNPFQKSKKTLVIDLNETLVHSSFSKPFFKPDLITTIESGNHFHPVYVFKRPFLTDFLEKMAAKFELVIMTASVQKYANLVVDFIDPKKLISYRLYREHCTKKDDGSYVKELKRIGRDMKDVIVLDDNSASHELNRDNALPIKAWIDDRTDREFLKIGRVFDFLAEEEDVRPTIKRIVNRNDQIDYAVVDMMINKRKKDLPWIGNNLTYGMTHNRKEEEEKRLPYTKIQYPPYINNTFLSTNQSEVKKKLEIEDMISKLKAKRLYAERNQKGICTKGSYSPKASFISPKNSKKSGLNKTLDQIVELRNEIERTSRYFVY